MSKQSQKYFVSLSNHHFNWIIFLKAYIHSFLEFGQDCHLFQIEFLLFYQIIPLSLMST